MTASIHDNQVAIGTKATATEVQTLGTAVSSNTTRIDNILHNTSDTALDSLAEIVSAFQTADASLQAAIAQNITGAVGTVGNLNTAHNTTLVGAVNELHSELFGNDSLNALTTETQANVVRAINEVDANSNTNAGAIASLTSTVGGNSTSIGNAQTDISANTSSISANASAISANVGAIAANTAARTTNAGAISTNANSIAAHGNTLSANTSSIAANNSHIGTNAAAIATNIGNISTNTGNIATNAGSIGTHATAIDTNTAAAGVNAGNISTNTGNISTNTSNISANTSARTTNASNIAANVTAISASNSAIGTNASGITSLNTLISTNASTISANTAARTTNASNIAANTGSISTNATNIASNLGVIGLGSLDTTANTVKGGINELHGDIAQVHTDLASEIARAKGKEDANAALIGTITTTTIGTEGDGSTCLAHPTATTTNALRHHADAVVACCLDPASAILNHHISRITSGILRTQGQTAKAAASCSSAGSDALRNHPRSAIAQRHNRSLILNAAITRIAQASLHTKAHRQRTLRRKTTAAANTLSNQTLRVICPRYQTCATTEVDVNSSTATKLPEHTAETHHRRNTITVATDITTTTTDALSDHSRR